MSAVTHCNLISNDFEINSDGSNCRMQRRNPRRFCCCTIEPIGAPTCDTVRVGRIHVGVFKRQKACVNKFGAPLGKQRNQNHVTLAKEGVQREPRGNRWSEEWEREKERKAFSRPGKQVVSMATVSTPVPLYFYELLE